MHTPWRKFRAVVSVVVPTLNEAANLPQLCARVDAALQGTRYELLVVDDGSTDGTPAVCDALAARYPIRLHVRPEPFAGLSGAVLHGFSLAAGDTLVVMDADLQHPPEAIPDLIDALARPGVELAIGSRYVAGGSTATRWGLLRRINSRVATFLARPFAGDASDPMSGFFALRRATLDRADALMPLGYKIGLELMCKCRVSGVAEVPIHFAERVGGESKLTVGQQFKYLEHLSRLYDFCFPRGSPIAKFLLTTSCAWLVGLGLYLGLLAFGAKPAAGAALSYPAALLVTTVFHLRYLRTQRPLLPTGRPWRDFAAVSITEWAACALATLWIAARSREIHILEVFVISYAVATVTRYVLRKELLQDIRGLRREADHVDVRPTAADANPCPAAYPRRAA